MHVRAIVPSFDTHGRPRNCDPLILHLVEPREPQRVFAVEVGVLAMREPPASLVVGRAVGVADVAIRVHRRELHVVLVVQRVARVASEAGHGQPVAVCGWRHAEVAILCQPRLAVDVFQLDAEGRAVVGRQVMERVVSQPELAWNQGGNA